MVSIGPTTLHLGTHRVSDVLAGWATGRLVLLALSALLPLAQHLERVVTGVRSGTGQPRRPRPGAALPTPARMRS